MGKYSVAKLAEWDLKGIARHALQAWGSTQSRSYIQSLINCFQLVADDPALGPRCESLHPGLRHIGCNDHVCFYTCGADGVLVARVLHRRMVPPLVPAEQ